MPNKEHNAPDVVDAIRDSENDTSPTLSDTEVYGRDGEVITLNEEVQYRKDS
jgi:hypothetical protein